MRQESECAESIVDGHHDHAALHELGRIVYVALADHERSAVDPHHHRERLNVNGATLSILVAGAPAIMIAAVIMLVLAIVVAAQIWSKDVEEQAIFGRRCVAI